MESLDEAELISSIPHLLSYHPHEGIAVLGLATSGLGHARYIGIGYMGLDTIQEPHSATALSRHVQARLADKGADTHVVVAFTDDENQISSVIDFAADLNSGPGVTATKVFHVNGTRFTHVGGPRDGQWDELPAPAAQITEQSPTPAGSRDALVQQSAPHPVPTYPWLQGQARQFFASLPPTQAAVHVTRALDQELTTDRASQIGYLLTRDTPTRDMILGRIAATSAPGQNVQRMHALTEIARGCPRGDARSDLYACAAFGSLISVRATVHTESLLHQVTGPNTLAKLTAAANSRNLPADGLRQSTATVWTDPDMRAQADGRFEERMKSRTRRLQPIHSPGHTPPDPPAPPSPGAGI